MIYDIVCFSHLRWNFVYQRPQHLLTRFARYHRVFFIEEPIFDAESSYHNIYQDIENGVFVVTPRLRQGMSANQIIHTQKLLLENLFHTRNIDKYIFWYYSPMALPFSEDFSQMLTVYDCMDELSAFKFASPELKENEVRLMNKADLVFTGGHHLYEAKKHMHENIYPVPSSIDKSHFAKARQAIADPPDQKGIPYPRLGFYGVIDERFNLEILEEIVAKKPDWNFVLIGPVVKIDVNAIPKKSNVYHLGAKDYKELPSYLSSWDIAIMPFALNESTKYISPTKTPEFLAAGKPVISTSIRDVVIPYGKQGLVSIADTAEEFIKAGEKILSNPKDPQWLTRVDQFLKTISWDDTWAFMNNRIAETIQRKKNINLRKAEIYV